MSWWDRIKLEFAATAYAERLPRALVKAWGKGDFYTPDQIRAAAKTAYLNPTYIGLGYAAFLPKNGFDTLTTALPLTYEEARALVRKHGPQGKESGGDSLIANGALFGTDGSSHHHSGHHSHHDAGGSHHGGFDGGGGHH